jgi:small subunit ribosomal protein S6
MRPYETLVVLSSSLGSEQKPLITKFEDLVKSLGGTLDETRDWGSKRLAYQIRKQSDGHFYLIEYQADGDVVAELERNLRITDGVLRYVTVQQEHTGLPEPREREMPRRDEPLSEMRGDRDPGRPGPAGPAAATAPAADAPSAAAPSPATTEAPASASPAPDAAPAAQAAPATEVAGDKAEEKTNE